MPFYAKGWCEAFFVLRSSLPCPPGELTVWEWCRNQQEEEEEEDEEELGAPKQLCGVRSTHNFESSFAPKMI